MDSLPERLRLELDQVSPRLLTDYLIDRCGDGIIGSGLPRDLRQQVESIAGRMSAGEGHWTLEFVPQDGRLMRWFRHHGPIPPAVLETLA